MAFVGQVRTGRVVSHVSFKETVYSLSVYSPETVAASLPGQFAQIRAPGGDDLVLRRPFSFCGTDPVQGTFTVVYEVRGEGTRRMAAGLKPGDTVDFMGPLGHGFTLSGEMEILIAVGGGTGIFPLLFLLQTYARRFPGVLRTACLGFRNLDGVLMEDAFRQAVSAPERLHITTDDGSYCRQGNVLCALEDLAAGISPESGKRGLVCACGSHVMLQHVAEAAKRRGFPCEVSLEERMACGIGACLVCACALKPRNESGIRYGHVCHDGPVFPAEQLIFDSSRGEQQENEGGERLP